MQSKNWFTSEIKSSFNHYKVMFTNSLCATLDSSTLKKIEHRDIKCSFENTFFNKKNFEWQSCNKWQSNKDYLSTTKSHKEIYFLNKVIKLSKELLKSKLLWSSNRIKMTVNYMKNAKHFKDLKWVSEIQ